MWTFLANLIGGPIINGAIKAYETKLKADGDISKSAERLAVRTLELDQREAEVNTEYKRSVLGRWYEPVNLLGYIFVFYVGKVVVWDMMLGLGVTPALKGDVATWAGMYMIFLLGKRGVENSVSIIGGVIRSVWRKG